MNQVSPVFIAQLTDIHLFAAEDQRLLGMPTTESFQAVIKRLKELQSELDFLILTGNLSGDATGESYENLQDLLNPLKIPTYWLPGNHDCAIATPGGGIAMDEVLNLGMVSRRKSFKRGNWNFILLNSSVAGSMHGHLSAKTLDWLDSELKLLGNNPTLVSLHHPPFLVNSEWLDINTLQNSEELFAILDRHSQVKLVLFGHIHQEFQRTRHNVDYLSSPSTCVQFLSDSPTFAIDDKFPGFRLLKLYPNGTWETWVERVPYFCPPESEAKEY
ncbi:3',5'-cyclic-AMP phosphodiesterase [Cylindrospermum sp. FACHB-282]|uniref:3',5'-cyclic-AMP phosphodiesterase n=1 Tax=Cylindrospermum sp. FACHB-282 TaxID=2692794 RepID=UPI001686BF6D|nr:3',5'-cyclic-AMP phosphodiesterase [Cylindrospermum sp. FACHB-282]MBD2385081.1 3',5'-cyclic-AMP phosphodiesterase [Cylindrospermum sp. FACHB-282]